MKNEGLNIGISCSFFHLFDFITTAIFWRKIRGFWSVFFVNSSFLFCCALFRYTYNFLGTVPALAANIAENAVLFTAYGYCQKVR